MPPRVRKTLAKKTAPKEATGELAERASVARSTRGRSKSLAIKVDPQSNYVYEGFFDSVDGVAYAGSVPGYAAQNTTLPGQNAFIQWLNTKEAEASKSDQSNRFQPVKVVAVTRESRTGMAKLYAEFLQGAPQIRIEAALKDILDKGSVGVKYWRGAWVITASNYQGSGEYAALQLIKAVAAQAKVSFGDARDAVWLWFSHEFTPDIAERLNIPSRSAVQEKDEQYDDDDTSERMTNEYTINAY